MRRKYEIMIMTSQPAKTLCQIIMYGRYSKDSKDHYYQECVWSTEQPALL